MKKVFVGTLAILVVGMCATASARSCGDPDPWDDLAWWGNTGATPAVYKDAVRAGYWWWPDAELSGVSGCGNPGEDTELWGNRGLVYAMYTPPPPPPVVKPPPPPPRPKVLRQDVQRNDVLFDFDKSNLRAGDIPTVDSVVEELKTFRDDTLVVEGHTDNIGSDAYNDKLGQRRADAVKQYIVEHGVGAARVGAKSLGESQPAVDNDTPAHRQLNRRAVFKMTIKTKVPAN